MNATKPRITQLFLLAALLAAAPLVPVATARAATSGAFGLEVLVDGRPLHEYRHAGRTYVEAREGAEYALRVWNRTGRRVAVALAVDGLNTIDAKHTSMRDAAKWVVGPHDSIVISGWQTGRDTARRFFFTTEDASYGAWLGERTNLGSMTAAFFPERIGHRRQRPGVLGESRRAPSAGADESVATGIGREVGHAVREVRMRVERRPAAVIDLRYENRDALVRLGVLPAPAIDPVLERRERATGFSDRRWAPDPFAHR